MRNILKYILIINYLSQSHMARPYHAQCTLFEKRTLSCALFEKRNTHAYHMGLGPDGYEINTSLQMFLIGIQLYVSRTMTHKIMHVHVMQVVQ